MHDENSGAHEVFCLSHNLTHDERLSGTAQNAPQQKTDVLCSEGKLIHALASRERLTANFKQVSQKNRLIEGPSNLNQWNKKRGGEWRY